MGDWSVIGHEWAVKQLQLAVARDEIPHGLLITGPANVGKRTLALVLAQAMLCNAEVTLRPCHDCSACRRVASGNHPDLLLVDPEDAGRGVKIEQIRELERFIALTPNEGRYKIALISDFERANPSAANALLKTLEEPPSYAHLVLLATDADTLLPTIVSRAQHIPLRPLDFKMVEGALQNRWQVPAERARYLARLSGGRLGWAVEAITNPDHLQQMKDALDTLLGLLQGDLPMRFAMVGDLVEDQARLAQILEYWRIGWRDILLLQTDNAEGVTYIEYQLKLQDVAQRVDIKATAQALRALGEAQLALESNANTRLLMETLFLDLPEV